MSEEVKNFIDKMAQNDMVGAGDAFKDALRSKVGDALDVKRQDTASAMFKAEPHSDPKPEIAGTGTFTQDGHFAELKNSEMMRERLNLAREVRDYIGKYYSVNYVRRNILRQTETEIKKMDAEIKKEIEDGIISSPEVQTTGSDDLI